MRDIKVRDLIDLVVAGVPNADGRVEQMFEWHFERDMTVIKWLLGAAASLVVSTVVALLRAPSTPAWWQTTGLIVAALLSGTYGFYRLRKVRDIHSHFIAALRIHSELMEIRPFLVKYRREGS